MPWFCSIMPRSRCQRMRQFLRLVDDTKRLPKDDPDYNKLFKRENIIDCVNKHSSGIKLPQKETLVLTSKCLELILT